jgi:hypothetical protein
MQNRRFYADSSKRVQRWRAKQGKMVTTYIGDAALLESLKNEAKFRGKPVWKLLRATIVYGLPAARQRGWWRGC